MHVDGVHIVHGRAQAAADPLLSTAPSAMMLCLWWLLVRFAALLLSSALFIALSAAKGCCRLLLHTWSGLGYLLYRYWSY